MSRGVMSGNPPTRSSSRSSPRMTSLPAARICQTCRASLGPGGA
ncbi:Uncharacterised protein [Mycobacteroides abscessus subsp. abscessus]|nr:Uncharacterised protein [Mycobacteroides abscessus subsp. abscessus]